MFSFLSEMRASSSKQENRFVKGQKCPTVWFWPSGMLCLSSFIRTFTLLFLRYANNNVILPMLRIPNRQNLLSFLQHTEFSVQKIPACKLQHATVGHGIAPCRAFRLVDFTTGGESHPALKIIYRFFSESYFNTICTTCKPGSRLWHSILQVTILLKNTK